MNLKDKLEHKLLILEKKIIETYQGISYLYLLFKNLKLSTTNEDVRQIFIKNELKLNDLKKLLKLYEQELKIFSRHKEVISLKSSSLIMALKSLENLQDEISNLITDVQSKIVYWEYSEYNK